MKIVDKVIFKYHLQWSSPKHYENMRWWAFGIWNEYDDWLYNGIHGMRILGF